MTDLSKFVDCGKIAAREQYLRQEIETQSRVLWKYLRATPDASGVLVPFLLPGSQRALTCIEQAEAALADVEKDIAELLVLYGTFKSVAEIARALGQQRNMISSAEKNLRVIAAKHVRDGVPAADVDNIEHVREASLKVDRAKADSCAPDLDRRLQRIQEILEKYV